MFLSKYKLELIVFLTGACVMILELVGSRVLAPYLGTSIVVWTSLIGLILASLSLGYWWGGRLADTDPSWRTLAAIIFLAGLYVGLVGLTKTLVLEAVSGNGRDIRLSSILATLILFCPPSVLLGMVSPYAVKLKIKALVTSGTTVGTLYAISTIGSIVGTFLTGFILIAIIGHTKIIFLIALTLILTALLAAPKEQVKLKWFTLVLFAWLGSQSGWLEPIISQEKVEHIDTLYNHIRVFSGHDRQTGRPIRLLQTDPFVVQSGIFIDEDSDAPKVENLVFPYTRSLRLVNHFVHRPRRALALGGAAYTQPRDFLARNPEAVIDVVEIDPGMTAVAERYFDLKPDRRLTPYHEDARTFLNRAPANSYDAIFVDAYYNIYAVPYQLTTVEAVQRMFAALNDQGVVLANLITALEGEKAIFLEKEFATYATVFPYVYLFRPNPERAAGELQNVTLVAIKDKTPPALESSNPLFTRYLEARWTKPIAPVNKILTDDFAPVEQLALRYLK